MEESLGTLQEGHGRDENPQFLGLTVTPAGGEVGRFWKMAGERRPGCVTVTCTTQGLRMGEVPLGMRQQGMTPESGAWNQ